MYAKKENNQWWLYFDTSEEAKAIYSEKEHHLWQDNIIKHDLWGTCPVYNFLSDIINYRRQLTDEFQVREGFEVGDPVCWCGVNGEVAAVREEYECCVEVRFNNNKSTTRCFYHDGRYLLFHKTPSLFHGHDVLRPEDQRFPVVHKPKEPKELPSQEVGKCIPHWLDNYKHALAGEWDGVSIGSKDCYLCQKYVVDGVRCQKCPIAKDTGKSGCNFSIYRNVAYDMENNAPEDRNPAYIRGMVLYLLDLQKRLEKQEAKIKVHPRAVGCGYHQQTAMHHRRRLMGQAKRRGTFEERKAQAIKEGREKKAKPERIQFGGHPGGLMEMFGALFGGPVCRRR